MEMYFIKEINGTRLYDGDVIKLSKSFNGCSTFLLDNGEVKYYLPGNEKDKQPIGKELSKLITKDTKITLQGNIR